MAFFALSFHAIYSFSGYHNLFSLDLVFWTSQCILTTLLLDHCPEVLGWIWYRWCTTNVSTLSCPAPLHPAPSHPTLPRPAPPDLSCLSMWCFIVQLTILCMLLSLILFCLIAGYFILTGQRLWQSSCQQNPVQCASCSHQ